MTEHSSNGNGRYLYAIVAGSETRNYGPIGMGDSTVYTISEGGVAAVVSDVPDQKMRPERRHLAAHQSVLKKVMEDGTPLPMSFGIVADDPQAVRRILSDNQQNFLEQLDRMAGKVEMGLRVTWDVPNIFDYFVQTHSDLRAARDQFFGTHREPTQEEKIEIGRMFDRMLNEDREVGIRKVENVLSRRSVEMKRNKCAREKDVMNLACLVESDKQPQFEDGIFEAANLFDNNYTFDYNGPWAPHNFVDMELSL
jgi:hypothetical protein